MAGFAQDNHLKLAHVNSMEIFNAMPETGTAETEIANMNQSIRTELETMEEEYRKKSTEFYQQQDSLTQSIKVRRMQEVNDLRERIQTFYESADQDIKTKTQELNAPIVQKIQNAIKAVGDEQGFTHMMEAGAFLYISPKAIDATPFVKAKLGLK
ncbi:hypothetical protein AwDysgo_04110 [Bacteroidales bacterium]|nr:hypothetical protein AwDysgo_04110 [Bacteroidales bacterium]